MSLQPGFDIDALKNKLLEQVKELSEKGLLPGLSGPEQALKLVNDVIKALKEDNSFNVLSSDLNSKGMNGVFQTAIMGQHLNNKGIQFDYKLLFKAPTPENQKLLKEELVKLLKLKLNEEAKKDPALAAKLEQNQDKVDKFLSEIVDKMLTKDLNKKNDENIFDSGVLMKVMDLLDVVADSVRANLRGPGKERDQVKENLETRYNIDTRGGSESRPVFVITAGRELGELDQESNPTSYSAAGRENTPDYGRYDPNGTVWATILNFLSANMDGSLEYELKAADVLPGEEKSSFNPSPFKTTPKPPGTEVQ